MTSMATRFATVDDYIAAQPEASQPIMHAIREAIREAVPEASEAISYNIPGYTLKKKPLLSFAGWKRHYSFYPAGADLVAAFAAELTRYEIRKSTLQIPLTEPAPTDLIARMAKFRARKITGA